MIFGATFLWLPESPTYLVKKNYLTKAEKSIIRLRGSDLLEIQREIVEIKTEQQQRSLKNQTKSLLKALKRPESVKSLIIVYGLSVFQQFCGIFAITFYTTDIFSAAKTPIPPDWETVITGVIKLIMCALSAIVVDKWGRKKLLIFSGLFMGVCLFSLGTFFYFLDSSEKSVEDFQWVPVSSLSFCIVAYYLGFGPVGILVRTEICSSQIKGEFEVPCHLKFS